MARRRGSFGLRLNFRQSVMPITYHRNKPKKQPNIEKKERKEERKEERTGKLVHKNFPETWLWTEEVIK